MSSVIVAISSGFSNSDYIAQTLASIVPDLGSVEITIVADSSREAVRSMPPLAIEPKFVMNSSVSKRKAASLVKENDFSVIFWDGRSLTELVYQSRLQRKPIRVFPVLLTLVANKDRSEYFDVYVGRGTPWGNPYPVGVGEDKYTREEAIEKYVQHFNDEILSDPSKVRALKSMRGLTLGCHCKPLACHGDVIAAYLNNLPVELDGDSETS